MQNSLDVPTNSVAQVAAAIEERTLGLPSSKVQGVTRLEKRPSKATLPGRAFTAPRTQSLERARIRRDNLDELAYPLIASAPKQSSIYGDRIVRKVGSTYSFKTPPSNRKGRIFGPADADEINKRLKHMRKGSLDSTKTSRSATWFKNSGRYPSSTGFYLQEPGRTPGHDGSIFGSSRPSLEVKASLDKRRSPSAVSGQAASRRDKGKARMVEC